MMILLYEFGLPQLKQQPDRRWFVPEQKGSARIGQTV
jgi:hypothetical protein